MLLPVKWLKEEHHWLGLNKGRMEFWNNGIVEDWEERRKDGIVKIYIKKQ